MKNKKIFIVLVTALVVITGLFMINRFKTPQTQKTKSIQQTQMWTCGMHPSVVSDKPGKCPLCGMDLIPKKAPTQPPLQKAGREEKKEETYYGCGVGKFGCCPKCDEKKEGSECICGGHKFVISAEGGGAKMVCPICKHELKELTKEEAAAVAPEAAGSLSLNKTQVELSGIATAEVKKAKVFKEIRASGKIAYDPELNVAQEEFIIALDTLEKVGKSPDSDVIARAKDLVEKSKVRLKISGMSDEQIKELEEGRAVQRSLIQLADKAWVYADIYEYELGWIKEGLPATVTAQAYPGEEFKGVIKAVSPIIDPNTRTARVRLEIDNPEKKLKLEMFVDVFIEVSLGEEVLAVAREAILDTGTRKIVWLDMGEGNFVAREIKTGPEGVSLIEEQKVKVFPVLSGLLEGEYVVTKGNFLLDSQSQLTGGMSVLWGGAQEIKGEGESQPKEEAPAKTQHRH